MKERARTCRAHRDSAPAEQQEREPALCADADDDHIAGQLRHEVAHEEQPGSQPVQEVGQPDVLRPTKQVLSGAQLGCLPMNTVDQQVGRLSLSPTCFPAAEFSPTSASHEKCFLERWQATHNTR